MSGRTGIRRDAEHTDRTGAEQGRGFRVVIMLAYFIFAISATARSLVQILTEFDQAPVAFVLSLLAAVTYIVLAVLVSRPRVPITAALTVVGIELAGVIGVGLLSIAVPALFPRPSVWSHFGSGYGYVPLVLPIIAGIYLLHQRRRGVKHAA
ncbi:hypothetical protein M3A96_03055 [Helcobacillus massiliensis]|uniref:Integral membrane protein n=1 Tax=Helcobacillus massiliensis TaxID=521392 RepID=A0A839QR31_9MICO|nr:MULTISPECIES: hypothetical protein [Helcobacillus]MBB3022472.1 hypothetical protein [Helcobacillus massiliensis]MCG7427316.1 hypothetical protein [Helcobacillus sp. ACRRO]MCT1557107.1 hypothetical protein [Helcobacillus massiliensis]MCT2036158.1 hypothetical protein [Helcobacillus massiliensis]MCT2331289.1 hypothetical protein [Helcobacillus massiliensis]